MQKQDSQPYSWVRKLSVIMCEWHEDKSLWRLFNGDGKHLRWTHPHEDEVYALDLRNDRFDTLRRAFPEHSMHMLNEFYLVFYSGQHRTFDAEVKRREALSAFVEKATEQAPSRFFQAVA